MTVPSGRRRRVGVAPSRDGELEQALLARLAAAVGGGEPVSAFSIRPLRSAGRSRSYVVEGPSSCGGPGRWFVKQSRPDGVQDDLDAPVSAEDEFRALERLYAHLAGERAGLRVPRPEAVFPDLSALAMEHVSGRRLVDLLRYGSLRRPSVVLDAVAASGRFLGRVHELERLTAHTVDVRAEAESVLELATEWLEPAGLFLPPQVDRTLRAVAPVVVESRQVLLHGDFVPHNVLLADDGSLVGVDPALVAVGSPEEDLARFIVVTGSAIRFAPGLAVPALRRLREVFVERLLAGYGPTLVSPVVLELRQLQLLPRRWLRLRRMARQQERGRLVDARLRIIEAQIQLLMTESADRLVRQLSCAR